MRWMLNHATVTSLGRPSTGACGRIYGYYTCGLGDSQTHDATRPWSPRRLYQETRPGDLKAKATVSLAQVAAYVDDGGTGVVVAADLGLEPGLEPGGRP